MSSIGLQLYSIKERAEADLLGTLAHVATAGYDGVEFAGYYDVAPAAIRARLGECGLAAAGAHVSLAQLETELERQIELALGIGCPAIGCPGFWDVEYNLETFMRVSDVFNRAGERCAAAGLAFYYHVHGHEFVDVRDDDGDGRSGMDVMLAQMDPALVMLQPDTYWVAKAGVDPAAFVREHADRCLSLHLKDAGSVDDWRDTEVGAGVIDMAGVIAAAPAVEWLIVEQEAFDMPPEESIAISAANARKLIEQQK